MNAKIGVLLESLGDSQLAWEFISAGNSLVQSGKADIIGFYCTLTMPCTQPLFAAMPASEICGYSGCLIATSLTTAGMLADIPGPSKRIFFSWDLEWTRLRQKDALWLASMYRSEKYLLAARSPYHAHELEQCWGRKPELIVDGFDLATLGGLEVEP